MCALIVRPHLHSDMCVLFRLLSHVRTLYECSHACALPYARSHMCFLLGVLLYVWFHICAQTARAAPMSLAFMVGTWEWHWRQQRILALHSPLTGGPGRLDIDLEGC